MSVGLHKGAGHRGQDASPRFREPGSQAQAACRHTEKSRGRNALAGRDALGSGRTRPGMHLDVYRNGSGEAVLTDNDEDIAHLGLDGIVCRRARRHLPIRMGW